jgi:DeoR family transcriptional regulator, aga operon transcriptional repressor
MVRDLSIVAERTQEILQELLRTGRVTVDSLAQRLRVSTATIRRDLGELERRGLLRRNHGGAVSVEPALYEPFRHVSSFQEQEEQLSSEKRRIGLAAAEMISDGETIALGAGTTTTQVARSLRHRKGITVVTNAVNIAMELSHQDNIKILLTGGVLSGSWFALVGPAAIQSVSEFFLDKAFIGVDGIHADDGLTTNYPDQATIHRAMLQQARQKIVVADHRKIGVAATALIWPPKGIDLLITDRDADEKSVEAFIAKGIKVRCA